MLIIINKKCLNLQWLIVLHYLNVTSVNNLFIFIKIRHRIAKQGGGNIADGRWLGRKEAFLNHVNLRFSLKTK